MWLRSESMIRAMLLLSCAAGTVPLIGKLDRNIEHHRPEKTDEEKDESLGHGKQEGKGLSPDIRPHLFNELMATTGQANSSIPDPERPSWVEQCTEDPEEVLGDLDAVSKTWEREGKLEEEDFSLFGLCSDQVGKLSGPHSELSALVKSVGKDRGGLHIVRPIKEVWDDGGPDHWRELTLHFLLPALLRPQLGRLAPVLLFSLGGSVKAGVLSMSFTGHSLQPQQQMVCISSGTQHVLLSGRQMKSHARGHVALRIKAEINQTEKVERPNLQELLTGERDGHNGTQGPLLLFRPHNTAVSQDSPPSRLTADEGPSPASPAHSSTFLFLHNLQKFLSEILSPEKQELLPARAAPISLDSLQSLPPLTLDASSSEALLLWLLNSSVPTIFSFPSEASELVGHRVELALRPPLLAMLRLQLEEARSQIAKEAVGGCSSRKLLRKLQELSSLPAESEAPSAGMETGEAQYRAVLLLKAMQTVLGAWEKERGLRAARGGQETMVRGDVCRLQPLTVSLQNYVLAPPVAAINNCQGACRFPLTEANNHVILLNSHQESGLPLDRTPCCVPLEYEDLQVMELSGGGTEISVKPNMVAKKCGCR